MARSTTGKQIHVYFPHTFQSYYVYMNEVKVKTLKTCVLLTLTLGKHGVRPKVINKEHASLKSIKDTLQKDVNLTGSENLFISRNWEISCQRLRIKIDLFAFRLSKNN